MPDDTLKRADVIFEVSWEVCNKVGGIYTVLSSKAKEMTENYGADNYYCIGPYFMQKVLGEFQETVIPDNFKGACDELKQSGIICHFGNWLVKGEPKAILIDFQGLYSQTNDIKEKLWDWFKIDSLNCPFDVNEPLTWAYAAGMVIEKASKIMAGKKIVAQFHEWLSASGLLYLRQSAKIATVFTTHATILGRAIASNEKLYEIIGNINPEEQAYKYGIQTKYLLERTAAQNSDVFTTVSDITGMEAEHLLKKKPDVILPNGLDMESFPSFEEGSIKHKDMKFRIKEFMLYYFFPYYSFGLDEALIFFIFCRYEFKNKGIDTFIKALARLNNKLKEIKSDKTIVAFFFVPTAIKSVKQDLVENKEFYEDIKESVDEDISEIRNKILVDLVSQTKLSRETIFSQDFLDEVKKKVLRFSKQGLPGICTHDIVNENSDAILNMLLQLGLDNHPDDRVKVVFYPTYLTGADGLLDLNYYEAIVGGHLGVFPSIYEPWGYTPLEAGALGVASITTDLSGFGQFVNSTRPPEICNLEHCDPKREKGIFIARAKGKSEDEIVDDTFNILYYYAQLNKTQRIDNKIEARKIASLADWKMLIANYIKAHNLALEKRGI